jgi:hypothetical protein
MPLSTRSVWKWYLSNRNQIINEYWRLSNHKSHQNNYRMVWHYKTSAIKKIIAFNWKKWKQVDPISLNKSWKLDQSVTSALNIKNEWSNKLDREEKKWKYIFNNIFIIIIQNTNFQFQQLLIMLLLKEATRKKTIFVL